MGKGYGIVRQLSGWSTLMPAIQGMGDTQLNTVAISHKATGSQRSSWRVLLGGNCEQLDKSWSR